MDENPYESPTELELPEDHTKAPKQASLALRVKRITQVLTLTCALLFFLIRVGVIPAQQTIVPQILFGCAMLGLVVIIACNYFLRPGIFRRKGPGRLKVK